MALPIGTNLLLKCLDFRGQSRYSKKRYGSVAQWLEQGTHKPKVASSTLARAIFIIDPI
jgi:hypothetical protein